MTTGAPVLLAGDMSDLSLIRRILADLPADTTGRAYIEVFSPVQIQHLEAPEGVSVHWIRRDQRLSEERVGACAARGEALARAIAAWAGEWLTDGVERECSLWIGARMSRHVDDVCRMLAERMPVLGDGADLGAHHSHAVREHFEHHVGGHRCSCGHEQADAVGAISETGEPGDD